MDPILKDRICNTAIIHVGVNDVGVNDVGVNDVGVNDVGVNDVGVNDLLNNKNTKLVKNLESTAIKCISNGIATVVVSGIANNNKMSDLFVGDVNKKISFYG